MSEKAAETAQELRGLAREWRGFARQGMGNSPFLAAEMANLSKLAGAMSGLFSVCANAERQRESRQRKAATAFQWRLDQLQRNERPQTVLICSALTRRATLCQMRCVPGRNRCRLHGGCSTGPKTEAGRQAIAESNRRRAEAKRRKLKTVAQRETEKPEN